MDWFVVQLAGSALALGAFAFGLTWWQSASFDRKWHPRPPIVEQADRTPASDRHRPAA